jgi:hypothetical protein
MSVIPATQEAEIKRITIQGQSGEKITGACGPNHMGGIG